MKLIICDMKGVIIVKKLLSLVFVCFALSACTEVGSEAWCEDMKEKPKGDWSANEAADFTKHCIL